MFCSYLHNIILGKYWNNTLRSLCPVLDDSEGITLTSLGGVFIATLVGLLIAMVVLVVEVTVLSIYNLQIFIHPAIVLG